MWSQQVIFLGLGYVFTTISSELSANLIPSGRWSKCDNRTPESKVPRIRRDSWRDSNPLVSIFQMKNLKTTISGVIAAIAVAWTPFVTMSDKLPWDKLIFAAAIAVMGWYSKDKT